MRNLGFAIGSFVLGIAGLILILMNAGYLIAVLFGIVGLILGILARKAIKNSEDKVKGLGMAIAGIGLTIITLLIWVIGLAANTSTFFLLK
ncbi:MAG: DUF4190 domain-containing protein [Clostridiaceae bacterium]